MTKLTRIGNSQGVRIPKSLISQAKLENAHIEFEVVDNGLLLKPVSSSRRKGWKENIEQVLSKNSGNEDEALIHEMLDDSDLDDYQW